MALNLDVSKLTQSAAVKPTAHDNCIVLDLGTGTFPRDIEVRLPDDDGARQNALWDGSLNLAVNDEVLCFEYSGISAWRIMAMGGNDGGAGQVRVSEVWESDFGAVALQADAAGNIGIGVDPATSLLHVQGGNIVMERDDSFAEMQFKGFGASFFPFFSFIRGRGTIASPTAIQSGDVIGLLRGSGYQDGTTVKIGTQILFAASENWSSSGQGSYIRWDNTAAGATVQAERMRLDETGLSIGLATFAASKIDIAAATRSGSHASGIGLYMTASSSADSGGAEFRHSNGTQGIGLGFNTVYAAGSNTNQSITIKSKGTGTIILDPQSGYVNFSTNFAEFVEMTAPSGGAANTCRIYAEDNGAGKTRLMAIFNTGAAQQIAIEP